MSQQSPNGPPYVAPPPPGGATITTVYLGRQVNAYAVFEPEIESFSTLNTIATVAISLASGFISMAIGIEANAAFAKDMTPAGEIMAYFVAPGLVILGVIAGVVAGKSIASRRTAWQAVKAQSKARTQEGQV